MSNHRPFARKLGLILLGLGLLMRAMLPQGFMPVAAPDGIRMVMCGGSGPVTIPIKRDGVVDHEGSGRKSAPCPYALAAAGADLASPPQLPAAAASGPAPILPQLIAAKLAAWRALRPPARGPPELA